MSRLLCVSDQFNCHVDNQANLWLPRLRIVHFFEVAKGLSSFGRFPPLEFHRVCRFMFARGRKIGVWNGTVADSLQYQEGLGQDLMFYIIHQAHGLGSHCGVFPHSSSAAPQPACRFAAPLRTCFHAPAQPYSTAALRLLPFPATRATGP